MSLWLYARTTTKISLPNLPCHLATLLFCCNVYVLFYFFIFGKMILTKTPTDHYAGSYGNLIKNPITPHIKAHKSVYERIFQNMWFFKWNIWFDFCTAKTTLGTEKKEWHQLKLILPWNERTMYKFLRSISVFDPSLSSPLSNRLSNPSSLHISSVFSASNIHGLIAFLF